jgi:hypothetical protein
VVSGIGQTAAEMIRAATPAIAKRRRRFIIIEDRWLEAKGCQLLLLLLLLMFIILTPIRHLIIFLPRAA